jgi:hypothetical protein
VEEAVEFMEDAAGQAEPVVASGLKHHAKVLKDMTDLASDPEEMSAEDTEKLEMAIGKLEDSETAVSHSLYKASGMRF